MRHRMVSAAMLVFVAAGAAAQTAYFPKVAFDDANDTQRNAVGNSPGLKALDEGPLVLSGAVVESYRLECIKGWGRPYVIRLDVNADGTGTATFKRADQEGDPAKMVVRTYSRGVTKERVQIFTEQVDKLHFWEIREHDSGPFATDQDNYVMEAARRGKYHVVQRWSPMANRWPGSREVFELAWMLGDMMGMKMR